MCVHGPKTTDCGLLKPRKQHMAQLGPEVFFLNGNPDGIHQKNPNSGEMDGWLALKSLYLVL